MQKRMVDRDDTSRNLDGSPEGLPIHPILPQDPERKNSSKRATYKDKYQP